MLVVATVAFGEAVRLFFFNFTYQIQAGNLKLGPHGAEGFRQIRYFPENGWTTLEVMVFIWIVVVLVMAGLWWFDRSRAGAVLRAVGEDELAAQSSGINVTAVKVSAMTIGGVIAGIGGGIFAHYTTHIEHIQFGVVMATFAIAYPILGGLSNVFGTLLAVVFIQGFLIEGLRFMGDWRNLLFGGLIVLAMNVRPRGLLDAGACCALERLFSFGKERTVLELQGITKHFGGVRAVDGIDLKVARGEILGLIGPNGSGKSTIVNLICGLFPLTAGRIVFNGADISDLPPHARVTRGIARTFQNIRLFGQLTVWQNLWVAQNSGEQRKQNFAARWLGGSRGAREEINRTLEFFDLAISATSSPAILPSASSGGSNSPAPCRRDPHLLLLDEPAAGMNAEEIEQLDSPHPQDAGRTASPCC